MPTTAPAVKAAIVAILGEVTASFDAQVLYGARATQLQATVIGVRGITTEVTRPTMGNSVRSRAEEHTVTVTASVFRPGPDAQQDATDTAYALIDAFAEHLRTSAGPTLGLPNGNIDGWVSGYELDEHTDDDDLQTRGRYAEVAATVTVRAERI
jgi:hypothetical protein